MGDGFGGGDGGGGVEMSGSIAGASVLLSSVLKSQRVMPVFKQTPWDPGGLHPRAGDYSSTNRPAWNAGSLHFS